MFYWWLVGWLTSEWLLFVWQVSLGPFHSIPSIRVSSSFHYYSSPYLRPRVAAPADGHGARGQAQEAAGERGGEDGQDDELEQDPRFVPWGEAVPRPVVWCGVVDG